jgi:hypothetical protein
MKALAPCFGVFRLQLIFPWFWPARRRTRWPISTMMWQIQRRKSKRIAFAGSID